MRATLILQNGTVFRGESIGAMRDRVFELAFHTGMTGHQEVLTDPAYAGLGVVMTYPLIGNYGVNSEDGESDRVWAEALIVRHLADRGSNFRCEGSLGDYLKQQNIAGVAGVDTRALTRILRSQGAMNGMITCAEDFYMPDALEKIGAYRVENAVARVTAAGPTVRPAQGRQRHRVALMDYGVKNSLIGCLQARGCEVTVFPASTAAAEVLAGSFDGLVLAGGPGDPADCPHLLEPVRALYASPLPLLAVGLGHLLLALATGAAETGRLPCRRAGSRPVRALEGGRLYTTAQNHAYTALAETVNAAVAKISFTDVDGGGVAGLRYARPCCHAVQFHPDGARGPAGTGFLFDRFAAWMGGEDTCR